MLWSTQGWRKRGSRGEGDSGRDGGIAASSGMVKVSTILLKGGEGEASSSRVEVGGNVVAFSRVAKEKHHPRRWKEAATW